MSKNAALWLLCTRVGTTTKHISPYISIEQSIYALLYKIKVFLYLKITAVCRSHVISLVETTLTLSGLNLGRLVERHYKVEW